MADRISEQTILEKAYDPSTRTFATTSYGYDGTTAQAMPPKALALKVTVSGSYTYIGKAVPGTAQSTARWQCMKVDESVAGTTVITWADGDANFDNSAADLTALSYS